MNKIPVKTDQIIKDLMQKTNAKVDNAVLQQKRMLETNVKGKKGVRRNPKGGK